MTKTVVVGAGVIGLSCALQIQEAGHEVTILAKDFPSGFETIDAATQINFTSPWGGAHNRFILPPLGAAPESVEVRDHGFSLLTWEKMHALHASNPESGITPVKAYDLFEDPEPVYLALTPEIAAHEYGIKGFRFQTGNDLPRGVTLGYEYDSWSLNPMVYCAFLLRRFAFRGGKIVKREIRDPQEVFYMKDLAPFDVLVNASGIGFGDPNIFIITGQTCLVANPCPVSISRMNAKSMGIFNIPRNFEGGTVIGGTKIPNNWDMNPSLELREKLLSNFVDTYPDILGPGEKFRVIKDIIGRRPAREGGIRLEKESISGEKCIIHAYGLGGRGYELSWGVADHVGKLLSTHLGSIASKGA
ncbi:FAD dependent oxidoreductase-like protein [Xylariaceae sp. FL0255]|nr:FAD dependent oxidoreductase-like protein [Xylariaceae sp. FL0255]